MRVLVIIALFAPALVACDDNEVEVQAPQVVEAEPTAEPVEPAEPEPPPPATMPDAGGPLVKLGLVELADRQSLRIAVEGCAEAYVFVEAGQVRVGEEEVWAIDTLHRRNETLELVADGQARVAAAVVRQQDQETECQAGRADTFLSEADPLPFAGGKLRVQILQDEAAGAKLGAFSILDGDPDISVPPHVHEDSAEVLLIRSGAGTMLQGEGRAQIEPGSTYYVPSNTRHGYEAGGQPRLRAYQIFAPPGPEQRFRRPPLPARPR